MDSETRDWIRAMADTMLPHFAIAASSVVIIIIAILVQQCSIQRLEDKTRALEECRNAAALEAPR